MNKLANPVNHSASTNFNWQTLKDPVSKSKVNYVVQHKVNLDDYFVSEQLFNQASEEARPVKLEPLVRHVKNINKKKGFVNGKRKSRVVLPNRVGFPIRLQSVKVFKPAKLPRVAQLFSKPSNPTGAANISATTKLPSLPNRLKQQQPRQQNQPDTSTNTNVYFWYYKETQSPAKKSPPAKKLPKISKIQVNFNQSQIIRVESEHMFAPDPSLVSESSQKTPRRNSIVQMILQPSEPNEESTVTGRRGSNLTNITKKSVGFTVKEEEENEVTADQVEEKIQDERISKNSTPDDFDEDYISGFPIMDVRMTAKESRSLTTKEMRELPLSEKFYKEAGRMIYEPKTAAFIPKGVNAYLARMKKNKETSDKKFEDLWYPGLAQK